eukprot:190810-Pelagomonas_calceolata.AAC.1
MAVSGLASQLWVPGRIGGREVQSIVDWYSYCWGRGTARGHQGGPGSSRPNKRHDIHYRTSTTSSKIN